MMTKKGPAIGTTPVKSSVSVDVTDATFKANPFYAQLRAASPVFLMNRFSHEAMRWLFLLSFIMFHAAAMPPGRFLVLSPWCASLSVVFGALAS